MRVSRNIQFDRFPHLGFEVSDDPGGKVHYVFWRSGAAPDDWQVSQAMTPIRMAGGRTVMQRATPSDWTLETGAWFRSDGDYRKFLVLAQVPGLLRMNADWTMHRDLSRAATEQVKIIAGRRYAEFDDVTVMDVSGQTFDRDGGVRCQVAYNRPYVDLTFVGAALFAEDIA